MQQVTLAQKAHTLAAAIRRIQTLVGTQLLLLGKHVSKVFVKALGYGKNISGIASRPI